MATTRTPLYEEYDDYGNASLTGTWFDASKAQVGGKRDDFAG